ncbi:hypothetical protein [Aestuariispira insulae]|uniref:Uncharacterized protein n=1 Tax=Aestuariispira insulae TaxID=1461337 RepID=A0A3D9HXN7_9PROT|nr:hypothetical protein [Aestuariispira insulae]RED54180.1 hypothetical protein DFP90_101983 [Aestuariispira insulae]
MTLEKLSDNRQVRAYFFKFGQIVDHLIDMAARENEEGQDDGFDLAILDCLKRLSKTFDALTLKYLFAGLDACWVEKPLSLDVKDSGFPFFTEILEMENDRVQARKVLEEMPDAGTLRQDMVDFILKYKSTPHDLRAAMAKRAYFQNLAGGGHFYCRNQPTIQRINPDCLPSGELRGALYLVTWSVYDSSRNQPVIYLMVLDDSGKKPILEDEERLAAFKAHIMNQSMSTLKLLTIAQGVDKDFADLHPKMMKRLFIGPIYSNAFTTHGDRLSHFLGKSDFGGNSWLMSWTVETLISERSEMSKSGLFGSQPKEIYHIPTEDLAASASGATRVDRRVIMPYEVRQSLGSEEWRVLDNAQVYVVGEDNIVLRL